MRATEESECTGRPCTHLRASVPIACPLQIGIAEPQVVALGFRATDLRNPASVDDIGRHVALLFLAIPHCITGNMELSSLLAELPPQEALGGEPPNAQTRYPCSPLRE